MVKNLPCSAGETGVGFLVLEDSTRRGATKSMVSEVHMPLPRPEAVKKERERERERERGTQTQYFPCLPNLKSKCAHDTRLSLRHKVHLTNCILLLYQHLYAAALDSCFRFMSVTVFGHGQGSRE